MIDVVQLTNVDDLGPLAEAALNEGFQFLERLRGEWEDGTNRFDQPHEVLFVAYSAGLLVGTGGLTLQKPGLGRVRRVYVNPNYRRQGIARMLMAAVLAFAERRYSAVVLYAETPEAKRLYEGMGFVPESADGPDHATHRLQLT